MAYQAATGAPPYVAVPPIARVISQFHARPTSVLALRPDLPAAVARLIEAMIDGDPAARPTAGDVAMELARMEGPYDDYELFAEGTQPGRLPSAPSLPAVAEPAPAPASPADRDWQQLVGVLGAPRRTSSSAPR
jgi:hypothetical protein